MSRWTEQLENHPIQETLKQLKACVESELKDADDVEFVERRRFQKIISAFQNALEQVDPEVITFSQIDALNNYLTKNVSPQATAYQTSGAVQDLTNANNQLDSQLAQLALLQPFSKGKKQKSVTAKLETVVDDFAQAVAYKKKELETQIGELSQKITQQDKKQGELADLIETRRQETDAQISEWQKQFSEAQESRNIDFNTFRQTADT